MKNLVYLLLCISILFSCETSTEESTELNKELKNLSIESILNKEKNETSDKLKGLLESKELNLKEFTFNPNINGKMISFESDLNKEILKTYAKLKTFSSKKLVDYNQIEFLEANKNNGHDMVILKGVCSLTEENVSIGIGLIKNKENSINSKPSYSLSSRETTCSGCTRGCSPRTNENGDGECTDCETGTSMICTKTETSR
jgi:hypothetical protein